MLMIKLYVRWKAACRHWPSGCWCRRLCRRQCRLWFWIGKDLGLGANVVNSSFNDITIWTGLLVEVILTFVFTLVVLGATDKKENGHVAGIVIGLALVLVHFFGIPFTGTSVNPARSIAPAVIQGGEALKQLWIFIVAPVVGAIISGLFYSLVLKSDDKSEKKSAKGTK